MLFKGAGDGRDGGRDGAAGRSAWRPRRSINEVLQVKKRVTQRSVGFNLKK